MVKTKTLIGHIRVFRVQKWFCLISKLVMFAKPLFFCRVFEGFAFDLLTISFFFWLFVFDFLVLASYLLLVVVPKSSFYVLVVAS